jgi:threonine/homoserine/homoserine lactone efflux protein
VDVLIFVRGLAIGFAIAAPVGPIGLLCIRRTLAHGRVVGFASGLGAATADAMYGAIAGFGLTSVSAALIGSERWMRLGGGVFLIGLGLRTALARPASGAAAGRSDGLVAAYASTLVLTLTNPLTILSFVAIFAGLGLGGAGASHGDAMTLVLGVFLGSALWWLILSGSAGLFHQRLSAGALTWINRLAGAGIAAFGATAIASLRGS